MELIHEKHKTSKFAPDDVISNMPDIVITNILDRLPIQDAVRTCVLSSDWRYKWTMLSQLVFDEKFFECLPEIQGKNNHVIIISRILLHLRGAITKFVLCIYDLVSDTAEDINHWLLFLSRKGIKDLTLKYMDEVALKLPTHLFSCLELKHLMLVNCCFCPPPSFHGFPNLLSLEFDAFDDMKEFGEVCTGCPLLEILDLLYLQSVVNIKLLEIAKLENLKILSLALTDFAPEITSSTSIFELLGSLPKLKQLHLDFLDCELTEGGAKKRFPTTFPCLKALNLSQIDFNNDSMVSCCIEMIRSSPNLQTLEITACESLGNFRTPLVCFSEIDYNTMSLMQLRSVVFTYLKASENEVCLVKYLLACSPILKKIGIRSSFSLPSDTKFMFARKLLKLPRASLLVDIDLH